jgi:Putative zinc-finger
MEHSEAIRLKAAEQYLLGELSGDLREQYEEHFFSCVECCEEVKAGAAFIDSARDILGSQENPALLSASSRTWSRSWLAVLARPRFAVPAMAILLLTIAYQNTVLIPHMKAALSQATAPQTLPSFSLITENSRGGVPVTITVPPNKAFSLYLDIPPQGDFPLYICEVENESGTPEFSLHVSREEAKEAVQLLIPPFRLGQGKHVLIVRGYDGAGRVSGSGGSEVARYRFTLHFEA